ncbi:endonuclease MutS2 [Microaerobacter geothermalis]|uniref:endonuclease MutS2 n=1 Tax=Microaerobacter geothermalis TaxID=674972 RepID=UPI001F2DAD7C|nr:endonuclease MutS2 [Microaerobacter geothermalis]MCF6092553.1 endonuclease MutS2 [Microaerobacter geothermalis]
MTRRVLHILEFDKVKEKVREKATSTLGKEMVDALTPMISIEEVELAQQETREGSIVLRLKGSVPLGGIRDIRKAIQRSRIGGMLSPQELLDISGVLSAGGRVKQFILQLAEEDESLPILNGLAQSIERLRPLEDEITQSIDDHGEVMDGASSQLRQIRNEIRQTESQVRERLERILRTSSYQKMLQEGIITIRNDRYVLPVKQEYRGSFGGIIHDQSASGATLFIEPEAVVSLNNRLRELFAREQREVEKVLLHLSGQVANHADPLIVNVESLARIDFIFAKAFYGESIKGTQPLLNEKGKIRLKKARHPLLSPETVVPIDVELGDHFTAMVVTGPNTGGKTVSLKTIGLLTLMAMSGLQIPSEEGSEISVFSQIHADIGDEQSIEQSLSTFSSHLTNIIKIIQSMDENSLILLDELGAGTDPSEGAALAIAILDHIIQRGAKVVATTHYSELKAYAYNRKQVINASVEFDVATLSPTYRLLVGVPGRSNAFAIAERLGLNREIIDLAKKQMSQEEMSVEKMIVSLEENRMTAEREREKAEGLRKELENMRNQLEKERQELEKEKNRILTNAEKEAAQAVAKARKEAEEVIAQLRKMALEEQTSIKEHRLIEAKKRLEAALPRFKKEPVHQRKGAEVKNNLLPGDDVMVYSLNQRGQILEEISSDEILVQIGLMKMKVNKADVGPVSTEKKPERNLLATIKGNREHIRPELDIRGDTIEDAIHSIDKYLDDAVISGLNQVSIIHGKGTGALRKGIQEYLKKHPQVKEFRLGVHGEGGSGVTVVKFN